MARIEQELIVRYTRENVETISAKIIGELVRCKDCKHHARSWRNSKHMRTKRERQWLLKKLRKDGDHHEG